MPEVKSILAAAGKTPTAREAALKTLQEVEKGRFPEEALERFGVGLDRRDRALANALVFGVLRHRSSLDWTLDRFIKKPDKILDTSLRTILRLGLFQLHYLDRVPASAAVNESVNLAKNFGPPRSSGLVNGVLRAIVRDKNPPDPAGADLPPLQKLALASSHPEWMVKFFIELVGLEEASALLKVNNQVPPLTLHVNTARTTRDELSGLLQQRTGLRIERTAYSPAGLRLLGPTGPIPDLPGYREGLFMVQDEASQIISMLAQPEPGEKTLDACAGRGGKALALCSLGADKTVWAMEPDPDRLSHIPPEAKRLGLSRLRPVRASLLDSPFKPGWFDVVLVDAPCSNLGVIRRRPDVKWIKTGRDPAAMAGLQARLLSAAARLVAPGGRLIYSVCTFTRPETGGVVDIFSTANPDFNLMPALDFLPSSISPMANPDGTFQAWPHRHGTDGFFGAVFRKGR